MVRNSKIILSKGIKMDREYKNIIDYSESDLLTLLRSQNHLVVEFLNCSFIRQNESIMVDTTYSNAIQSNYIAFQNPDYSNKWFFAWIDEVKYIGEKNVEIKYTVDEWSTWGNSITKKACFVEREHVADDTIGLHTIDEGLKCVNFDVRNVTIDPLYLQDPYIVVMSTYDPEDDSNMSGVHVWNGAVNGAEAFIFRFNIQQQTRGIMDLEYFLMILNGKDKLDAIQNIYVVPAAVLGLEPPETSVLQPHSATYSILPGGSVTTNYYKLDGFTFIPKQFTTTVSNFYSDLSYTPHNNKCLCFPYHYLYVTNNSGNANIYKGELFSNRNSIEFSNQLVMTPGVSARIAPLNYKGSSYNYDESIPLGKFPNCRMG